MQSDVRMTDADNAAVSTFLTKRGLRAPLLLSDPNTHAAAAGDLEERLGRDRLRPEGFLLSRRRPAPDEQSVGEILIGMNRAPDVVIGVGGGTLTDIARIISHRLDLPFLCYPTAPSVDAFSSATSAMLFRGVKRTIRARAAETIFVNAAVLAAAPHALVAAGFGDMIGKYTATADWRLSALATGEAIDAGIVSRILTAVESCVSEVELIRAHDGAGMKTLIGALIDSGDCMREWGGSRPASGSEHLFSHFWEARTHESGREAPLHGENVALASMVMAGLLERLAEMGPAGLEQRIRSAEPPDPEEVRSRARQAFGPAADGLLEDHPLSVMTPDRFSALREAAAANARGIIEIAEAVPPAAGIRALIERVGGPTRPGQVGLTPEDVRDALSSAHFIRNRFGLLIFCDLFLGDLSGGIVDAIFA
jgi:glycerol-1-phosphate dehydrogenase [NAD(P)+]